MYGIEQLQQILGLSENQVRVRLDKFRSIIDPFITRGARNKVLIDHSGLEILKRAIEYEKAGKTLAEIEVLLKQEFPEGDGDRKIPNGTAIEVTSKLIETYEERIQDLKQYIRVLEDQIREKDRQIERFQETIKSLPPSREEIEANLRRSGKQRVSRWTRLKQFLKGE